MRKGLLPKKPRKSYIFTVSGEAIVEKEGERTVESVSEKIITSTERNARKVVGEITPGFVRWKKATVTKEEISNGDNPWLQRI